MKKIVTPRALAKFRAQSGCASLNGIPIEDQAVGVDAHWEARVLGSELMAYVAPLRPPAYCLPRSPHSTRLFVPDASAID